MKDILLLPFRVLVFVLLLPFKALALIFGRLKWSAPPWMSALNTVRKEQPRAFLGVCVAAILIVIGYQYYLTLPKPITVKAHIQSPGLTRSHEGAVPDNVDVEFNYDFSKLNADQARPSGKPSVARIDLVGEEIKTGIELSPAKKGKWLWAGDRSIRFEPESDWPAGTSYTVKFDKSIFIAEANLSDDSYDFSTPEFGIKFSSMEFYQDPQDKTVRRIISTLTFTHPVEKASLEENLSMTMRPSGSGINKKPKIYEFDITYSKNHREAYIRSIPVSLPSEPNYMKITIDDGVKTILGGADSTRKIEHTVLVPDFYSFLKISNANTLSVRNEENEPEQVLMLEFTDDIDGKELLSKLSVYLLPERNNKGSRYWSSPREVSKATLRRSEKIDARLIPNERESSKLYSFVFDVPENRYIYMRIEPKLVSVNKFVHSSFYDTVLRAPNYPKEVDISGDGSVLTYSGDHKLSILSRGVPALKYKVGRLLEGQLYHLVTQTSGDIKSPGFTNWKFTPNNIADYVEEIVDLQLEHPKKAVYSSLDLSRHMPQESNRFGLFFVDVIGLNDRHYEIGGAKDTRLILVTDLGIIVKKNADATHDVFVQSIQTGAPVAGSKVELLGKNGIALYTRTTSEDGHVAFPSTNNLKNEKEPTVFVVKKQSDMSFIPYNRSSRQINLSRFDIGGVRSSYYRKGVLNAFAFSDRGIYRPGEKVNIGFVVKNGDLSNVEGIPLEIVIRGPRNNEVQVKKIRLPEKGLLDFQYPLDLTSDTGSYTVSIHLVRDNRWRGIQIGTTRFKVEEFQPDTMKIESRLEGVAARGWDTRDEITAKVTLQNLFGIPAQDRKMKGQLIITPTNFRFKEYDTYRFTDPYFDKNKKPLSINEILPVQQSDADGQSRFDIDLQRFREGSYSLQFIAEGFDQAGGRSVIASNSALISPLEFLVGYKADGKLNYINANSKRSIEFITIDASLNKVKKDDLIFRRIEIQHVSTLVKQRNGTYKYQSVKKEKEVESRPLEIPESNYIYEIDTETSGDFAIEIIDSQERRLSRVEYSVVGFGNLAGKLDKNAELQLKLNKEDYLPGELIEMNIKAPYKGAGLITIETDKIHHFKWFKSGSNSTMQTIRVPETLEGTAYVNVSFVRDVGSKEIFTSPLSYAVQPFSIDRSNRIIDVELDIEEIVRPGKPMEIAYQASKASKMLVFAVDEGILQVAKYKTPQPLEHFLKKRSLDVRTLQILDLILPEFDLIKELSASGGGSRARKALAKNLNPFARKVDKPAVYWSGVIDAGPERKKVIFNVPDTFAGSLKVMAIAIGDSSMGATSKTSLVRGPFVISPNVLTHVAPGDEFMVTVGVANIIDGSGKNADIEVAVHASKHLEILGIKTRKLKIDEGSEGKFSFKVKAKKKLGAAELTITAKHKGEDASRKASLSVRPAMPYYTSFESGFESSGDVGLELTRNLYTDLSKQSVAASASPLVLVDGLTSYLETFPHGCTEQVISKVFPLVGLMTHPAYGPHIKDIKSQFSHVIDKLRERQQGDGGFSFWPGSQRTAAYPTIYALHFLIESSELGYPVPTDMLQRGKDYLSSYAGLSTSSLAGARDRANAIYLLTRLGDVTTNYLVDLQEQLQKQFKDEWKQDLTASYMAATHQLLQQEDEASRLISGYKLNSRSETRYDDFHSSLTQDAQHIYLLSKHFESLAKDLPGEELLKLTSKIFKGEYNTISSAYSILALGAYSKLALDNDFDEKIVFSALLKNDERITLEAELKPFKSANYAVDTRKVEISGEKPLYYLNVQSGFNSDLPEEAVAEGIEIHRDFLDNDGNKVTSFEQGEEVTVRLRVRALDGKQLTNVAVIDLLPGGFEVVRSSVSRTAYGWKADYIDIREDRVVYYGAFDSTVRELTYRVKLSSAGDFVIPPSYAESMYDRSIRSVSKAGRFKVTATK